MATIYIDNRPYTVKDGQNLLHACLSLGFDLPYFCWHPALHSVGACRQCAVKQFKDEQDTRGRIVMACMTPAAEGMRISIDDPDARAFRAGVIELLMSNHPHDCPVCDEGGECHLQDMTVMTGHTYRRYRFPKRTHRNQDLGPFVNHEMNRCIACYRCVRFYRDVAGGRDLDVFSWHHHVYFGRHADGPLESEFSGNLVEVCPTGVFTDKTLKRHYTRKWDLETAPSICVHCGVGCNTSPGARYGLLRRIQNRFNSEVNGYFLCDRGRFGYEFVNSDRRIRAPLVREKNGARPHFPEGAKEAAVERIAALIKESRGVIGIGSPRASLEANFALRALVGPERFFAGLAEPEHRLAALAVDLLRRGPARPAGLANIAAGDAVLVLGEDVTNTAPMVALAVRQSLRQRSVEVAESMKMAAWDDGAVRKAGYGQQSPVFIATPAPTRLDDAARETLRLAPDDLARLGFAIAHALDPAAPAPEGLADDLRQAAERVAAALKAASRPVVISGPGCGSEAVLAAAAAVATALHAAGRDAALALTARECNTVGVALLGGGDFGAAVKALQDGTADTVIILENDLTRRLEPSAAEAFFQAAAHVIALDHVANETTARAEVLLPAATFAESDGTLVNAEGRAQRFFKVLPPADDVMESWRWLRDIGRRVDADRLPAAGGGAWAAWEDAGDVTRALAEALPVFAPIAEIAPPPDFRLAGQRIPRQPARYSGRTAMTANVTVHEPAPPSDTDSPLAFSMEGYPGAPPAALIPRFWFPAWNSIQAANKFQSEVGGPLRGGDPGRRLLDLQSSPDAPFSREPKASVPASPSSATPGSPVLFVPLYHCFGSEELSILSPGVAERAPRPYVALGVEDAEYLGLAEGAEAVVTIGQAALPLPVRIVPSMARGVNGLPVGVAGMPHLSLPTWGAVRR